jgi:hypothetical protein
MTPAPTSAASTSAAAVRMKRQGSIGEPHGSSSTMSRRSSNAILDDPSDRGIMMKDKERERFEDEGSIGKAGGVGVGVTRPKRRLSR